jgi:four helix bundle protein
MTSEQLKERFKNFGIRVLRMSDHLPDYYSSQVISKQITRSSLSAGANYRAACRSKSSKDFINKLKIVEEELDETGYWLTLIENMNFLTSAQLNGLRKEADELTAIIVQSLKTSRSHQRKKSNGD